MSDLSGFTISVTADRRRQELSALLERRGARVVQTPALRILPLPDDERLRQATQELLDRPADLVIATTGIGFRGWMEAAEGWNFGEQLRRDLHNAVVLARGPKARGAIRAAGLTEEWHATSETSAEVLAYLIERGVDGLRIAIQLHGEPLPEVTKALTEAGAEVVEVEVYRWAPPEDTAGLRRLVDTICAGGVDAVTFTSAAASANLMATAEALGRGQDVVAAFTGPVLAACVGPMTAAPLRTRGAPALSPDRYRLGALVRQLAEALPERYPRVQVNGCEVQARGYAVLLDGTPVPVPPASLAVLKALAERPGRVFSRSELRRVLPADGAGDHAVEMAVTRLRAALGHDLVETVIKRGYRLRIPVGVGG